MGHGAYGTKAGAARQPQVAFSSRSCNNDYVDMGFNVVKQRLLVDQRRPRWHYLDVRRLMAVHFTVAASLAEMSSMPPHSGGQYRECQTILEIW